MLTSRLLILGFVAGFVAVLIFHQGLWYLFNQIGLIPPERPAWPLDPIPPFGVPSVISKAFWGGVWGAVLVLLLGRFSGASYWANWILVGAIALPLVGFFVVSPLKGEPIPQLWPRFPVAMLLNGTWGFGTAFLLRLAGAGVPRAGFAQDPWRRTIRRISSNNWRRGSCIARVSLAQ
jgi:hypothetical protein